MCSSNQFVVKTIQSCLVTWTHENLPPVWKQLSGFYTSLVECAKACQHPGVKLPSSSIISNPTCKLPYWEVMRTGVAAVWLAPNMCADHLFLLVV